MSNEHIEDRCQKCGGNNPVWSADNDLWNKVVGAPNGILCPTCFFQTATAKGIDMFGIIPIELLIDRAYSKKHLRKCKV